MSTLLTAVLLLPMSEAGGEGESGLAGAVTIGLGALALLVVAVLALMAFGKGRDHS